MSSDRDTDSYSYVVPQKMGQGWSKWTGSNRAKPKPNANPHLSCSNNQVFHTLREKVGIWSCGSADYVGRWNSRQNIKAKIKVLHTFIHLILMPTHAMPPYTSLSVLACKIMLANIRRVKISFILCNALFVFAVNFSFVWTLCWTRLLVRGKGDFSLHIHVLNNQIISNYRLHLATGWNFNFRQLLILTT